ncbi:MAG: tRNA (adenosine(37)-N6)-threonylcarbamoyltransferase complex ATPase subunit type 1 TsaE [Lachnospiraceae bacterium]|nr:tRNA (adenosine(37)-N6)-threonylcarbamoyltransferase complex ATPase subunit type 1 TsaE [Lachnospiraceae bacterium]
MAAEIFETNSPDETFNLGKKLGQEAIPGTIIAMTGDLGVGKTLFTQGFAKGLGIDEPITSPTFTIMQIYESGRIPFYHFDVYRIADPEEMDEIGFENFVCGDGASIIEWAELIEEIIPPEAIKITIEKDLEKGFDYRKITVVK